MRGKNRTYSRHGTEIRALGLKVKSLPKKSDWCFVFNGQSSTTGSFRI